MADLSPEAGELILHLDNTQAQLRRRLESTS